MNAGFDAGPIQKMCGAGFVPGADFGENFTSLKGTYPQRTLVSIYPHIHNDYGDGIYTMHKLGLRS